MEGMEHLGPGQIFRNRQVAGSIPVAASRLFQWLAATQSSYFHFSIRSFVA